MNKGLKIISGLMWEWALINLGSLLLLLVDSPIIKEDVTAYLIIYHVVFLGIGGFLFNAIAKNNKEAIAYFTTFLLGEICDFIYSLSLYKNIKSAVYQMMLPTHVAVVFAIAFVALTSFKMIAEKNLKIKKKNLLPFILTSLEFLTVFQLTPFLETYFSNEREFSFYLTDVVGYLLITLAISELVLAMLSINMGKKKWQLYLILFTLSLAAYIQEMFLNNNLFLMDGKEMDWSKGLLIGNLCSWIIVAAILIVLFIKKKELTKKIIQYVAIIILGMQLVGSMSLLVTSSTSEKGNKESNYMSTEGLTSVATDDNVIIFVLDTFDVDYMNTILEEKPDFLDTLTGFTWFPDMVSRYSRTYPSIPYILSGKDYFFEVPREEYNQSVFEDNKFWNDLIKKDYALYFYEDDINIFNGEIKANIANYVKESNEISKKLSYVGFVKSLTQISEYRLSPYAYKKYFMYTSEMVNQQVVEEHIFEKQPFTEEEAGFYKELTQNGLTISQDEKAVRFIHLNGSHGPYTINRKTQTVNTNKTGLIEQSMGSMNLVLTYIEYLKEINLYDSSTIVITADHGENYVAEELPQATNPILFIKKKNVGNEPLQISQASAQQDDIITTLAAELDVENNDDDGIDLFNVQDTNINRIRKHYFTVVENGEQVGVKEYEVDKDSNNFENWTYDGKYKEFEYYR